MALLLLPVGALVWAGIGWLLLDLAEWRTRVLLPVEKWSGGFVAGLTVSMFAMFLAHVGLGVPLTAAWYGAVHAFLLIVFGGAWAARRSRTREDLRPALPGGKWPFWLRAGLFTFSGWVALRIAAFAIVLAAVPTFYDDTLDNWNLRGKIFHVDRAITLVFPWAEDATGVSSYPPTVPLAKAALASMAGGWHEGLANELHVLWFLALLALVYSGIRRAAPRDWALLGTTLLASLPLEFMQGTGTYADVFVSAHVLLPVLALFHALRGGGNEAGAWLRVAAVGVALVPFTKNEGWALYFPILAALFAATILWTTRTRALSARSAARLGAFAVACAVVVAVPWIGYKLANGLTFGNAKGLDFAFAWQPGVIPAVLVNTFLEANWSFLFPLAIGLLAARWRSALRPPLLLLLLAFALPYGAQHAAYMFTGLSREAVFQTGYARGIVHVVPILAILTTLLLRETLRRK